MSCDSISKMAHEILKERDNIIALFCKTFFVSQEPRSSQELRALFEICELEVKQNADMSQTFRIKLKNEGGFCGDCKNESIACVCMGDEE